MIPRLSILLLVLLACGGLPEVRAFSPAKFRNRVGATSIDTSARLFRGSSTQEASADARKNKHLVPTITTVETLEDFLEFLGQDEKLCVVKFHASWCKSCQKFGVLFRRWGHDVADLQNPKTDKVIEEGDVRLAEVEFGTNIRLCRALGIKKLPLVHIYKGAHGLVSAFPCGPNKFPILEEKVERLLAMSDDEIELEKKLDEGSSLNGHIVTELQNEHYEEAMRKNTGEGKSGGSNLTP